MDALTPVTPPVEAPPPQTKVEKALAKLEPKIDLKAYEAKADEIVVTDRSQVALMAQAKSLRLELRSERLRLEELRKSLKAEAQAEITAIDGKARDDRRRIEALEAHFQEQEDFAFHQEQHRLTKRLEQRIELLTPYMDEPSRVFGLRDMADDIFDGVLADAKVAFENALEVQRLAKIEAEAKEAETKRLREENERLEDERLKAAHQLTEERIRREALEQKAADALKQQERDQQAETDRKMAAEAAPDKEKLLSFITGLRTIVLPNVTTPQAVECLDLFVDELDAILAMLETRANRLGNPPAPF